MATNPSNATGRPDLEATPARQSAPAPGAFAVLVISTIAGLAAVALIWALFAGPLHHAQKPRPQSPQAAAGFNEGPPSAAMRATPSTTGTSRPGPVNSQ